MASSRNGHGVDRYTAVDDLPQLLNVGEASAWLGASTGLLYAAIRKKELASVRIGRLVRIPRAALATWIGAK